MALSATFTANFSNFYDAVDKADVKLADLGAGAEKVSGQLSRMADQFSGKKIVQDATLMVKAIGGVEGVTKLTEKEMSRLGATTNEAVAKLKALGKDVPQDLQAVADATKHANKQTTDWVGGLGKLAATMGIAFSVDAVMGFGASILDLASNIKDLSSEWGVSMQAVQQFTGAAKASGVEASTVGKAIQFMAGELAGADKQYEALITNLTGLSKAQLNAMPREEAFRTVIDGLMRIEDENERLKYGVLVLGDAWKKMGGAAADGFVEVSRAQKTWSDDQVKRLADAQQTWKSFWDSVVLYSGESMDTIMIGTQTLTKSWGNFFGALWAYAKDPKYGAALFLITEYAKDQTEQTKKATDATNKHRDASNKGATAAGTYGGAILRSNLVIEQQEKNEKALKDAQAARTKQLADLKAKEDAYRKTVEAQQKAIVDLSLSLSGNGLISQATKYLSALETSIPISKMTAQAQAEIGKAMADAIDVFISAGEVAPKAMIDIWLETKIARDRVVEFTFSLDELKKRYLDLSQLPKFDPFTVTGQPNVPLGDAPKEDRTPYIIKNIQTLGQALGDLGAVAGGTFGDIATDVADIGWAFDQATVAAGNMQKGLLDIDSGKTAEGMTKISTSVLQAAGAFMAATDGASMAQSILTGGAMGAALAPGPYMAYAAAAGMAVGALRGFMNAQAAGAAVDDLRMQMLQSVPDIQAFRQQVEDAGYTMDHLDVDSIETLKFRWQALVDAVNANEIRKAFIDTAGGVDELRKAAELAGFNIDKLLDKSVAGKELQVEIDALTEAFKFQDESMAVLIETAERYGFTLAELGPAMQAQELDKQAQGLFKDWQVLNAAGIETIDITNRMGESVSDYVNSAIAMGFEVPNAMKPMLDAMVESGDLLNANGEAITDLEKSGVSFSLTMSDGFKRLIDVVEKLTDSISRSLGLAIENVPDVQVKGTVKWDVGDPSTTSQPGSSLEQFAEGSNGFRNFGTGTPVMLHGWEAVVPRDDAASFAQVAAPTFAGASSAAAPSIVINAQGAFFDTPGDLQRLADRVNDALTAKYGLRNQMRAG